MTRKNKRALNRFFALLRRTRGWNMSGWRIRKEANFKTSYLVDTYCPLTGACRLATRKVVDVDYVHIAADLLGLHWSTGACLVYAADGEVNTRTKRTYRRRLLEATGLTE